jgi:hypothetical protein
VLFRSTAHLAHKTSRTNICRSRRNLRIAASARHFRREVNTTNFCILFKNNCSPPSPSPPNLLPTSSFSATFQSLFSKGTKEPEDVVQRCLTHFRKCDLPSLSQYLPPQLTLDGGANSLNTPPPLLLVGNSQIQEQGPLAALQPILDIGARRVLPGHLLRRSRVLGTLRLSDTNFQQRIALTAQSGEESVFTWHLEWILEEDTVVGDDDSSAERGLGRWVITKIERESEEEERNLYQKDVTAGGVGNNSESQLPSTPQPKSSPESVVYAQLHALQRGDVYEASQFNNWTELEKQTREKNIQKDAATSRERERPSLSLGLQFELLRDTLLEEPYSALNKHSSAVFGAAALPTQHSMLQEVWLKSSSSSSGGGSGGGSTASATAGEWVRFVWNLNLEANNGCWMCTKIQPYLDS